MSLVRLLATGKSLVGVKDESRYHVTNQRLLPKFGSAKNPFQRSAKRTAEPSAPVAAPVQAAPAPLPSPQGPAPSAPSAPAPAPAPTPAVAAIAPLRVAQPPARSWFGSLLAPLTRWFSRSSSRPSKRPQPAIPQFKAPVQTELRLDSIKVVRNDLSDSDLEVVSTKRAVAPVESAPAAKPEPKPEDRAASWGRGSSRLFSAGKTLR